MAYIFAVQVPSTDPDNPTSLSYGSPSPTNAQPDSVPNDGRVQAIVKNDGGSDIVFTILAQRGCVPFNVKHDAAFTIPSGGSPYFIGPFDAYSYNDIFGRMQFTCSTNTSVGIAFIRNRQI